MSSADRIALGTAQLGMDYGIANRAGPPTPERAFAVLDAAREGGVDCLDTAPAYGVSEDLIGAWCAARNAEPRIITKLPGLAADASPREVLPRYRAWAQGSLARLRCRRLWGLILHDTDDLRRFPEEIPRALEELRREGTAEHTGASAFEPAQVGGLLEMPSLHLLQVPMNPFDCRYAEAAGAGLPTGDGPLLLARSCFLQGLILLPPEEAGNRVAGAAGPLARLRQLAETFGLGVRELALGYVLSHVRVAAVVLGCETPGQVRENLAAAAAGPMAADQASRVRDAFRDLPVDLIDPSRWIRPGGTP